MHITASMYEKYSSMYYICDRAIQKRTTIHGRHSRDGYLGFRVGICFTGGLAGGHTGLLAGLAIYGREGVWAIFFRAKINKKERGEQKITSLKSRLLSFKVSIMWL